MYRRVLRLGLCPHARLDLYGRRACRRAAVPVPPVALGQDQALHIVLAGLIQGGRSRRRRASGEGAGQGRDQVHADERGWVGG